MAIVVNLINVAIDVGEYHGDADDKSITVEVMDELLICNDDNEDDVDGVDNVVCEVIAVDVVVDSMRVVAFQAVDDDNGDDDDDDDAARSALMHAKEKASANDETKVARKVAMSKDVYGDVEDEVVLIDA